MDLLSPNSSLLRRQDSAAAAGGATLGRPRNAAAAAVAALLHAALQLATIVTLLGWLPSAASQPPPPGSQNDALLSAASNNQCPVTVRYDVDLGRRQNTTRTPIFVGYIGIMNNYNESIEEWRLGWTFPYNATIKDQSDLFSTAADVDNPGSSSPVVTTTGYNGTLFPGEGPFPLQFLATKSKSSLVGRSRFNVGPIENVMFNNLFCSMVAIPSLPMQQPKAASPAPSRRPAQDAMEIEVEYTPIEFAGQPLVNTFTQFLLRLRNIKNNASIDLSSVSLQYWLQGPTGDLVLPYAEFTPESFFVVQCEWATTGCDSIGLAIGAGYPDIEGAHFVVNITMNDTAGQLLPSGENAVPGLFLGKGVDVMDLLITVTTRQAVALFNSTQDYSFMDTPQLQIKTNASIIPRRAMPNPHIPAFIEGELIWGSLPSGAQLGMISSLQNTTFSAPGPEAESSESLPMAITCEGTGALQRCGLSAVYCCAGPDPVSLTIPEQWPPIAAKVPPGLPLGLGPASEAPEPQPVWTGGQQPSAPSPSLPPSPAPSNPSHLGAAAPGGAAAVKPDGSSSSGGASKAWIAGMAAGLGVVAGITGFAIYVIHRRRQRRRQHKTSMTDSAMEVVVDEGDPHGKPPSSSPGDLQLAVPTGVPTNQQPLMLWSRFPDRQALSEAGSVRSSPSKDSQHPLLYRQPSAGRSTLFKFGSGMSAMSSQHDNPMFELEGEAGTPIMHTPQRILGWDASATGAHAADNGRGSAEHLSPANGVEHSAVGSEEGLTVELLAILEKKAATAAAAPAPTPQAPQPLPLSYETVPTISPLPAVQSPGRDILLDPTYSPDLAPWQLRRSKSWDGTLHETHSLDNLPQLLRRRRMEPQLHALPPLTSLPPPVLPSGGPLPDVDLDVDYEREIKPFLGRCLGTGGFGMVYECTWRGRRVAVKKLPKVDAEQPFSEQLYDGMLREIQLASKFNSERLVRVYGACTSDRTNVCLIMELMEGGNLFQRIYDRNKRRMSYLEILQLAHDVAAGLAYLHPSVVHRDLKPQNVLLDAERRAKLADFGIARIKDPTKSYLSVTNDNGTPLYMAPEQFNGSRVDEKIDVFALGVILNECHTRRQPWKDSSHFFQIILKVAINGERPWLDPDCPDPLRKLITRCWHQDPHMRPSPAEIMRLTEILMQEELRRWEELAEHQYGAPRPLPVSRLPSAPADALRGLSPMGVSPRLASAPAADEGAGAAAAAAVAPAAPLGATAPTQPSAGLARSLADSGSSAGEAWMVTAADCLVEVLPQGSTAAAAAAEPAGPTAGGAAGAPQVPVSPKAARVACAVVGAVASAAQRAAQAAGAAARQLQF